MSIAYFFDELYVRKLLTWLCGGGFLQTWGIFNLKVMLTTQSFLSLLIDNPSKLREIDWIFQGEKYLLAHLLTMFIPTRLGSRTRTTYILVLYRKSFQSFDCFPWNLKTWWQNTQCVSVFLNLMDFLKFSTSHHPYNALNNMEKAVVRMTSQFGTSSRIGVLWCRRRLQCCDQNFSKKQCCWLTLAASMKFSENDISQKEWEYLLIKYHIVEPHSHR